jgi:DNA polymerase III epsilon subunit-like protein
MQMCHCRVIDTVALFPHPRGPPYKSSLRYLATKYLQRSIQEGEHDSAVDARAAMDLALLKIEKGGPVTHLSKAASVVGLGNNDATCMHAARVTL